MIRDNKVVVSISLAGKDRDKVDRLAAAQGMNRSEMVRSLVRSKRRPKKTKRPIKTRKQILDGNL